MIKPDCKYHRTHVLPLLGTVALFLFIPSFLFSQDLSLGSGDFFIAQSLAGGYDLFIRKKTGIESVMLVESTKDPEMKLTPYVLRNPEYNPVNGDEINLIDGKPVSKASGYHIVDSSPEMHPLLGEVFRLFIPYIVNYGYPDQQRYGEIMILDGTFLNVRTFAKKNCDYTGPYRDNPFTIKVTQKPFDGPPEGNYMPETVAAYKGISEKGKGQVLFSTGEEDIAVKIEQIMNETTGETLDLVLAIDTTDSMENDMPHLRELLPVLVEKYLAKFKHFRIGLVYYKDYFDEYLTRIIPFEQDTKRFAASLGAVRVRGGRDIPEAVYEALYAGITGFSWQAQARVLILIGDAPPHPRPRGTITEAMVFAEAEKRSVKVHAIILPQ